LGWLEILIERLSRRQVSLASQEMVMVSIDPIERGTWRVFVMVDASSKPVPREKNSDVEVPPVN